MYFYQIAPQPLTFQRKQIKFVQFLFIADTLPARKHSDEPFLHTLQASMFLVDWGDQTA